MNAFERARDHYVASFAGFARSLGPEPGWLEGLRREALAAFAEAGLPDPKREEWRYTNLAPLARLALELAPRAAAAPSAELLEEASSPVFACSNYAFVEGRMAEELSAGALKAGPGVESLAALRADAPETLEPLLRPGPDPKEHPLAALNQAFLDDGALLRVPAGRELAQPMHVVYATAGGCVQHPRTVIELGAGARATLIQDHVSLGPEAGFTNAVLDARIGANAHLDLVIVQREGDAQIHVANLLLRQARDSRVAVHTLSLGGRLVRNDLAALLADEGAECRLFGLLLALGDSVIDDHVLVDHALPRGTSRQLYKGILGDRGRGVFRGRVVVRPDAQGSDAQQNNANLLLSDQAEVDAKPQLEIYADDVRCSHGSSTGQLDPEALFYLRSRGVDASAARELLTRGFARDVLDALPVRSLAEALDDRIGERLAAAARLPAPGEGPR